MRVLFTGASSFTGYWFVRALATAGHTVIAPLKRSRAEYEALGDTRAERVKRLAEHATIIEHCPFGSDEFLAICAREKFDLFCHHAAQVGDYKSASFDMDAAVAENTYRLDEALAALKQNGARAMLLTGSVFEANTGKGTEPLVAFSPYAESKTRTAEIAAALCAKHGLKFGKFIIPNVFGQLQEPRFYDFILKQWDKGETATITAPDLIRDHVPVDALALAYEDYAERMVNKHGGNLCAKSLYAEDMHRFTERMANEIRVRTNLPCDYRCEAKLPYSEPLKRVNTQAFNASELGWDEVAFWDELAAWYFPHAMAAKRH